MKGYGTTRRVFGYRYQDRYDLTRQGRAMKPAAKWVVRRAQKTRARAVGKAACEVVMDRAE